MNLASIQGVTYSYPRSEQPALSDASLELSDGEFSLAVGPSGGGKSTFLRLLNGLVPQFHGGTIAGSVTVCGLDAIRTPTRQLSLVAGMVFQEPEAQSVAETVIEEVAFGMEQRAVPRDEMHRRADDLLGELGIEHLRHRRQQTLSGGERQRVAIASVLAMEPNLLVLDEPTSQLDESGAVSLISALLNLRRRRGLSVVLAEHRLDRLLHQVDRVIEVEAGILRSLTPEQALGELRAVPSGVELFRKLGLEPTVGSQDVGRLPKALSVTARRMTRPGELLMSLENVGVSYGGQVALRGASFQLREGEIVALIGPNGSGKSSLFRAITGLSRPYEGSIRYATGGDGSRVRKTTAFAGLVPQDPAIALYRESVEEEIAESLANRGQGKPAQDAIRAVLEHWGIDALRGRNPRDISVGQQQRVAVAAMLAHEPRVWLLDEPTRGADAAAKCALAERLQKHAEGGGAAIVATHDIESAAHFASRVITLNEGVIISDMAARTAFAANGPHPTQVAQLVPGAISAEEVTRG